MKKNKNMDIKMNLMEAGIPSEKIHYTEAGIIIFADVNLESKISSTQLLKDVFAIYGSLNCSHNDLKELDYLPAIITGALDCSHNSFKHFSGSVKFAATLICSNNPKLESLDYLKRREKGLSAIAPNLEKRRKKEKKLNVRI